MVHPTNAYLLQVRICRNQNNSLFISDSVIDLEFKAYTKLDQKLNPGGSAG